MRVWECNKKEETRWNVLLNFKIDEHVMNESQHAHIKQLSYKL